MDSGWHDILWHNGHFLGIAWSIWKLIGWLGNLTFSSRFIVQWYATERSGKVVVPVVFWWLSLLGSLLLLIYALSKRDSVIIYAYLFPWIPYVRNLMIHYRHQNAHTDCASCGKKIPPQANYCPNCGGKVA